MSYGFAILGCGGIGRVHGEAIRELPDARAVVAIDREPERARRLADDLGIDADTDLDRALARPDVDVVSVCLPSSRHAEFATRIARAGKHVVVEKPIDTRLPAADELIAACQTAGVALMPIFQMRYEPSVLRVREIITTGRLGRPILAEVAVPWYRTDAYYSADWRGTWDGEGGGCLMTQGIHLLDLLRWLLGSPARVFARCATAAHDVEVEDVATASLEFPGGAIGMVQVSTAVYPGLPWRLQIAGTKGTVRVEDAALTLCQLKGGSQETEPGPIGGAEPPHARHRDQLADFLAALDAGDGPPVTGQEARDALALVLAIYESAHTGKEVELDG